MKSLVISSIVFCTCAICVCPLFGHNEVANTKISIGPNDDRVLEELHRKSTRAFESGEIDQELEVRLQRLDILSRLYGSNSDDAVAESCYIAAGQQAKKLAQQDFDEEVRARRRFMTARILAQEGKLKDSIVYLNEAIEKHRTLLASDPFSYNCLYLLGQVQLLIDNPEQASKSLERCVACCRSTFGNKHVETAHSMALLSLSETRCGRYDIAEQLASEAKQIYVAAGYEEAISYGRLLLFEARRHNSMGAFARARDSAKQAISVLAVVDKEYVPSLAMAYGELGIAYSGEGNYKPALRAFQCWDVLSVKYKVVASNAVVKEIKTAQHETLINSHRLEEAEQVLKSIAP